MGGKYSIDVSIPGDIRQKKDYLYTGLRFWRDANGNGIKDALMSPNQNQTKGIEDISDSVSFQTLMFMLDHSLKTGKQEH